MTGVRPRLCLVFLPIASITVPSDQTLAEAGTWGRAGQFAGPTESPSMEKGGRDSHSQPEGGPRWVGCDL